MHTNETFANATQFEHFLDRPAPLELFRKVCSAVGYAHKNLVVHRDIKPSNILVTTDGTAKLLDFGIAKLLTTDSSITDTRPGMRPMTLDYASPEQATGGAITTATDIYSLGVLLYKLLTGRFPYGDKTNAAELHHAIRQQPAIPGKDRRDSAPVHSVHTLQVGGA